MKLICCVFNEWLNDLLYGVNWIGILLSLHNSLLFLEMYFLNTLLIGFVLINLMSDSFLHKKS